MVLSNWGGYPRIRTGPVTEDSLRLPAGRKAAQLVEVVASLTTTDPCDALEAAEDCLTEAASNEDERAVC